MQSEIERSNRDILNQLKQKERKLNDAKEREKFQDIQREKRKELLKAHVEAQTHVSVGYLFSISKTIDREGSGRPQREF